MQKNEKAKRGTGLRRLLIILAAAALLLITAAAYMFISLQIPSLVTLKRHIKYDILGMSTVDNNAETKDLSDGYTLSEYENGILREGEFDEWQDNHRVYNDGSVSRLVSYYGGYQIDLPAGSQYDFSYSAGYVLAKGDGFSLTASREWAPYQSAQEKTDFALYCLFPHLGINRGVEDYVDYYEYRFLMSPDWQAANGVTVTDESAGDRLWIYSAVLAETPEGEFDGYIYVTYLKSTREYVRVMWKYNSSDTGMHDFIIESAKSTRIFDPRGNGHYSTDFAPEIPDIWTEETRSLYNSLANSDSVKWGIFVKDVAGSGIDETIPALEEKLDYEFDIVLHYIHLSLEGVPGEFPTAFMQKNYDAGRIVELTYQTTDSNNEYLYSRSGLLDAYRGKYDSAIRAFAKAAKEFGHPFLFRLNNEMNSDWCSYSGVINMCDPEIYRAVWQRIYNIFEEEGVGNCIWIYNPNDRNCPPSIWNDSLAYYPGNGYVQMFGITGYNNGIYYTKWAEEWREFDEIYGNIQNLCLDHFGKFPWIITEFASSSIGGDKAAWIDNMFATIGNFPNIKAAVWFSYADFDGETAARPYWLDETEATTEAFRRGLANYR